MRISVISGPHLETLRIMFPSSPCTGVLTWWLCSQALYCGFRISATKGRVRSSSRTQLHFLQVARLPHSLVLVSKKFRGFPQHFSWKCPLQTEHVKSVLCVCFLHVGQVLLEVIKLFGPAEGFADGLGVGEEKILRAPRG